jgi:hypothetical protein
VGDEGPGEPEIAVGDDVAGLLQERATDVGEPASPIEPLVEEPAVEEHTEVCAISWWRGYAKAQFFAHAVGPDGHEYVAATSPMFRWGRADPPARTKGAMAAHHTLVKKLRAEGWEPASATELWYRHTDLGRGDRWFEDRFRRFVLGLVPATPDPGRNRTGVGADLRREDPGAGDK